MPAQLSVVSSKPLGTTPPDSAGQAPGGPPPVPPGRLSVVSSKPLPGPSVSAGGTSQPPPRIQITPNPPVGYQGQPIPPAGPPSPGAVRSALGMAGSAVAGVVAPELVGAGLLARVAAPALGAAAGGGAGAAISGTPVGEGAQEQAGYELAGQAISWPFKVVGRRIAASRMGQEVMSRFQETLQKAQDALHGAPTASPAAAQDFTRAATGVSPTAAGQQVEAVAQGPARHSLNRLGQAVEDAAQTGPAVDLKPVKARLQSMQQAMQPQESTPVMIGGRMVDPSQMSASMRAGLTAAGISLEASHPLPGALGQLAEAPDTVPFAEAHKYKRMLDDATNWNSPARKQVQGITKGIRGTLREAMSGHEPYDQATEAYKAAVPLFTKGTVAQLHRSILDNPESLVKTIKGDEPTKIQMLFDVLHSHAEAGGGGDEGKAAWNAVRSAWTDKNLIAPGVEKFDKTLSKMDPEFLKTMYGDAEGQQMLGNLKQLSGAFQSAYAKEVAGKTAARQTIQDTRQQIKGFSESSVMKQPTAGQTAQDLLHTALMPHSVFSLRAYSRLGLSGPKTADLVKYAALSQPNTQMLVKALASPQPGQAIAALWRAWNVAGSGSEAPPEPPLAVSHGGPPKP